MSEVLETVFRATNADSYARAFDRAATTARTLATAERQVAQTERVMQQAQGSAASGLQSLAIQYLTVREAVRFVSTALSEYRDAEQDAFTARLAFNSGSGLYDQMDNLATATSRLSGFDDDLILKQEAMLHNFGVTEQQIRKLIPAIADLARGSGVDFAHAAQATNIALIARQMTLNRLGVQYKKTGDMARDANALMEAIETRYPKAAQQYQQTYGYAQDMAEVNRRNIFEIIGGDIGRNLRRAAPGANAAGNWITDHPATFLHWLHMIAAPAYAPTDETEAERKARLRREAPKGPGPDPQAVQNSLLGEIAGNTAKTADALLKQSGGVSVGPLGPIGLLRGLSSATGTLRP